MKKIASKEKINQEKEGGSIEKARGFTDRFQCSARVLHKDTLGIEALLLRVCLVYVLGSAWGIPIYGGLGVKLFELRSCSCYQMKF